MAFMKRQTSAFSGHCRNKGFIHIFSLLFRHPITPKIHAMQLSNPVPLFLLNKSAIKMKMYQTLFQNA